MENSELELFQKTIVLEENTYVFIQPLCDFFDINVENQSRIIKNDIVLESQSTKKSNNFLFNDNRQRTCLTKKGFIRWIQLLNPNIVKPELRQQLIQYQTLVFDYIYGQALVPNIQREYAIENQQKEINAEINRLMLEDKKLEQEKKQLKRENYQQLGLFDQKHIN